jgi:hypothetical protein
LSRWSHWRWAWSAHEAKGPRRQVRQGRSQGESPYDAEGTQTHEANGRARRHPDRASPAKAAVGDDPVFAYFRSLPQPQRGIAERVDALVAKTLPNLQRCVKWGMAWYGVGDGWCFSCGGFAGHVRLTFGRGTSLEAIPPVTPIGMGKDSRGVDLKSARDLNEPQVASWIKQATAIPGFGGKRKR